MIGAKVLYYRRLKGWTQKELSDASGVSRSRISDIECGKGPYNIESILLIAQALEVEYQLLMEKKLKRQGWLKWLLLSGCVRIVVKKF